MALSEEDMVRARSAAWLELAEEIRQLQQRSAAWLGVSKSMEAYLAKNIKLIEASQALRSAGG
jgi:hypothetical protein